MRHAIRDNSDFWESSLVSRNNAESVFKGATYKKKTIKATNSQFNQENTHLGSMFFHKTGKGLGFRMKTIEFINNGMLEHLILTRANNMRAFYIETIRIFTVASRNDSWTKH